MRVTVDPGRCDGYGNCVMTVPDVFDLDDEGRAVVVEDEVEPGRADVLRAVVACPYTAISTHED
ncbi:ferredoxin [Actinacidiphila alni]|uniref:Ferredoxin n=1 Tax=Actinacidiphila alni TaxID=380248 RepID=A0A1I2IAF9_9ACTN|nr:ferredoxin [Actinacidiphila alni]SFF39312.1 ferredoxin [Actinacidiphila alni]